MRDMSQSGVGVGRKKRVHVNHNTAWRLIYDRNLLVNSLAVEALLQDVTLVLTVVMSLLIRYSHIPFYFYFSVTSSTPLIHH